MENICRFVPYQRDCEAIHTINFVLETEQKDFDKLSIESVYKMYYVAEGRGKIHVTGNSFELSKGDVFFTVPSFPFCIESGEGFTFMYISFLGARANMIFDKLSISSRNFIFKNVKGISEIWKKGLEMDDFCLGLTAEGVLLFTFSAIGNIVLSKSEESEGYSESIFRIKKYIDENLSNPALNLELIGRELHYNRKYISTVFKKQMKMGFSEYLSTMRIQLACTMIEQGYRSVGDIARLCGYDDTHYFSKVFKKKMACTPKNYILREK